MSKRAAPEADMGCESKIRRYNPVFLLKTAFHLEDSPEVGVISGDGSFIARIFGPERKFICIYNVKDQMIQNTWDTDEYGPIESLSFSGDGQKLFSSHKNGKVVSWNKDQGVGALLFERTTKGEVNAIHVDHTGRKIMLVSKEEIEIWETVQHKMLIRTPRDETGLACLSDDGKRACWLGADGVSVHWAEKRGCFAIGTVQSIPISNSCYLEVSEKLVWIRENLSVSLGHSDGVQRIQTSASGEIVTGQAKWFMALDQLHIWRPAEGPKIVQTIHGIQDHALSRNGKILVVHLFNGETCIYERVST